MGLIVTTGVDPSEKRLVTLAKTKARLGITVNTYDTKLTEIIDEVSQLVVDFLGYDLAKQTYTETLAGNARTYLMLARVPLVSVTTVSYQGTALTDYSIADYDAGLLYRESGWTVASPSVSRLVYDPHPGFAAQDWSILYTAGYALPAGEEPDTTAEHMLPYSLRSYVYDMISFFYGQSNTEPGLKSRSIGGSDGVSEEYFSGSELGSYGFPLSIEKGLNRWKRY
jgi:hypothetical protein